MTGTQTICKKTILSAEIDDNNFLLAGVESFLEEIANACPGDRSSVRLEGFEEALLLLPIVVIHHRQTHVGKW